MIDEEWAKIAEQTDELVRILEKFLMECRCGNLSQNKIAKALPEGSL